MHKKMCTNNDVQTETQKSSLTEGVGLKTSSTYLKYLSNHQALNLKYIETFCEEIVYEVRNA